MDINYDKLLQKIIDIGEEMIVAGAEVSRVEDSIYRMCSAYGFQRINVYIITNNLQVTVESPKEDIITHIRRIVRSDTNFAILDSLNALSRYIVAEKPTPQEIKVRFYQIFDGKKQSVYMAILGGILIAGSFAIFFGGTLKDGLAGVILGLAVVLFEKIFAERERNQVVFTFVTSVVAGILAIVLCKIGLGENVDKIMIGGVMLLIPGMALTNGVRDILIGDTATGLLRLTNAVLLAGAIAAGFAITIIVFGGLI